MRKQRKTPVHGGCRDPRIADFQTSADALGLDGKPRPDPGEFVIVGDNEEPPKKCVELIAALLTPAASDRKPPDFGDGLKTQREGVADQVRFL